MKILGSDLSQSYDTRHWGGETYLCTESRHNYSSLGSTSYLTALQPHSRTPSATRANLQPPVGWAENRRGEWNGSIRWIGWLRSQRLVYFELSLPIHSKICLRDASLASRDPSCQRHPLTRDQIASIRIPFCPDGSPILRCIWPCRKLSERITTNWPTSSIPFRGIALLLHLRKNTLRLVIDAMRALGHLAITLDLLLAAHVTGLRRALHQRQEGLGRPVEYINAILPAQFSSSWPHSFHRHYRW